MQIPDLGVGALPNRQSTPGTPATNTRPDESFWKDLFAQATELQASTPRALAGNLPSRAIGAGQLSVASLMPATKVPAVDASLAESGPSQTSGVPSITPGQAHSLSATGQPLPQPAWCRTPPSAGSTLTSDGTDNAASPAGTSTPASFDQTTASTAQARSPFNAILAVDAQGRRNLYMRAHGLTPTAALTLAGQIIQQDANQQPIHAVHLNGRPIYEQGSLQAPGIVLTA
jgi:hypothetical protein